MIVIVDYGMGNLRSVQKAFERIRVSAKISSNINEILLAEKLVLPGVGHFEHGINNLKDMGLFGALNEVVLEKKIPILGICLGMQLMTDFSEEGNCSGFGWIKARTQRFSFQSDGLKIPHMGWNNLSLKKADSLFKEITTENFFYFVHSYYISCSYENNILAETNYGNKFVSSFQEGNIFGCQFHPEKSHDSGLQILKNFAFLENIIK
jgi:imidazole glycerol-phosphate synthase subunit HisH